MLRLLAQLAPHRFWQSRTHRFHLSRVAALGPAPRPASAAAIKPAATRASTGTAQAISLTVPTNAAAPLAAAAAVAATHARGGGAC